MEAFDYTPLICGIITTIILFIICEYVNRKEYRIQKSCNHDWRPIKRYRESYGILQDKKICKKCGKIEYD